MFKKLFLIFFTTAILLFAQSFIFVNSADALCTQWAEVQDNSGNSIDDADVTICGIPATSWGFGFYFLEDLTEDDSCSIIASKFGYLSASTIVTLCTPNSPLLTLISCVANRGDACDTQPCCPPLSCIGGECCNSSLRATAGKTCYCDAECISGKCWGGVCILDPPANPIYPANNSKAIDINPDLSIILRWEAGPDAQKYIYRLEGGKKNLEASTTNTQSEPISATSTLKAGSTHFWQVRSCADLDANGEIDPAAECGNYSSQWNFKFLLNPPTGLVVTDTNFPVQLNWSDVIGAQAYDAEIKINLYDCDWHDYILNFLNGIPVIGWFIPDNPCSVFQQFIWDPIVSWFRDTLGFLLGWENYDASCPWILWNSNTEKCEAVAITATGSLKSEYKDDTCVFTKNTAHKVRVSSCLIDGYTTYCGPYGDEIGFTTGNFPIEAPKLVFPTTTVPISVVGSGHSLRWNAHNCSNYIHVTVNKTPGGNVLDKTIPNQESLTLGFGEGEFKDMLDSKNDLDKNYNWQVYSCWRTKDNIECNQGSVSEVGNFKTIGAPPLLLKPAEGEMVKTIITWENIDGAGSYSYQIANDAGFLNIVKYGTTKNSSVVVDYNDILPADQYWWRVSVCSDPDGNICGDWSASRSFNTYPLNPPSNPNPTSPDGQLFVPGVLSWNPNPGASFYQIKIANSTIDPAETLEGCETKEGAQIVPPTIVSEPRFYFGELCQGKYMWQALSCWDKDCVLTAPANWSDAETWTFSAVAPPPPEEKGLLPCGRRSDNLDTPYNEREPCQLKHAGFLIQNILDFLLWRLGLIIMAILAVVSGVTSYFSLGSPNTLVQIKSIWKSAGIGWIIMLLAWTFINLIMRLTGFQVEFFGRWWQLPF